MIHLRIQLEHIEPPIWRELVVPMNTPLDTLHMIIQGAMAWEDTHLHEFEIDGQRYEFPDDEAEPWEEGESPRDERQFFLGNLVKEGDEFLYTYDFGDNWRHKITVVKKQAVEGSPDTVFPSCLDGGRACPPEDCGGPYSYGDFIASLNDPKHAEHKTNREWAGNFESEIFSTSQANSFVSAMYVWGLEKRMQQTKFH